MSGIGMGVEVVDANRAGLFWGKDRWVRRI